MPLDRETREKIVEAMARITCPDAEPCGICYGKQSEALTAALPLIGEAMAKECERNLNKQELLLHTGEMTAQEIRSCMAVIKYLASRLRSLTQQGE